MKGQETVIFANLTQYYKNNELTFILRCLDFDPDSKELEWTKTCCGSNQEHAREKLKIIDENTIIGTDSTDFAITYTRIGK